MLSIQFGIDKSPIKTNNWTSRKLWVLIAFLGAVLWLFSNNVAHIFSDLVWLIAIYIIAQTAHDIAHVISQAWVESAKAKASTRTNETPCLTDQKT